MRLVTIIASIILLFAACTGDDICREDLDRGMYANLYKMVYDDDLEQMAAESYSVQMSVNGVGNDSIIYDETLSTLYLPLQKFGDTTSFALTTTFMDEDSVYTIYNDTIHVYHTNEEEFVSLECGCAIMNTINSIAITTNVLDSVIIENSLVTSSSSNNIKIYLKDND
ncbi:MAG: DUF6452 family protein [bacterium]